MEEIGRKQAQNSRSRSSKLSLTDSVTAAVGTCAASCAVVTATGLMEVEILDGSGCATPSFFNGGWAVSKTAALRLLLLLTSLQHEAICAQYT